LIAAAAIGLSFANTWMCTLVSIGVTADEERSGFNFILGRLIGIILIGMTLALIGAVVQIPPVYFIAVFGILTVIFGIYLLLRIFDIKINLPFFRTKMDHKQGKEQGKEQGKGQGTGLGNGQGKHHGKHGNNECRKSKNFKGKHVFILGLFRGATPCLKIMILAPLLIAADFWLALAIVIVYAVTSTVYPIMGFLFGSLLRKFERYHTHVRIAGAIILIFVGIYSIVNGLVFAEHPQGG
jgi:cytochrome c biogenesis protein CcdA